MSRMLNVRVEEDLADAIDLAAKRSDVPRSVWMREVLASAVDGDVVVHPKRSVQMQGDRDYHVEVTCPRCRM